MFFKMRGNVPGLAAEKVGVQGKRIGIRLNAALQGSATEK